MGNDVFPPVDYKLSKTSEKINVFGNTFVQNVYLTHTKK